MSDNSQGGSGFSWFLAGLGLGSLLGVLYAPKPGQETREDLFATAVGSGDYVRERSREVGRTAGNYVERGRGQVTEYVSRSRGQVNQYVNRGKGQLQEYVVRGKDAVEAGRQKINETYGQSVQTVAGHKEKLAAAYDAGRQAFIETEPAPKPVDELIPKSDALS